MSKQLTQAQIDRLQPYEKYFGTAIRSGYCSFPGEAALKVMRDVWLELTGQTYPYNPGCSTCIFNVVKDMGLLYYAATGKDAWDDVRKKPAPEEEGAQQDDAPANEEGPDEGAEPAQEEPEHTEQEQSPAENEKPAEDKEKAEAAAALAAKRSAAAKKAAATRAANREKAGKK